MDVGNEKKPWEERKREMNSLQNDRVRGERRDDEMLKTRHGNKKTTHRNRETSEKVHEKPNDEEKNQTSGDDEHCRGTLTTTRPSPHAAMRMIPTATRAVRVRVCVNAQWIFVLVYPCTTPGAE
jgi:hypothetical protein